MTGGKRFVLPAVLGIVALAGGYVSLPDGKPTAAIAQVGTVTFPGLEELIHYTTVLRGATREHMLTTPGALTAIQAGQPVPTGTHVVLVDHQSDVLARYLIAEKTGDGPDDWAYQAFNPDASIKADDESPGRCYSCHQTRQSQQYMFTFGDAASFEK